MVQYIFGYGSLICKSSRNKTTSSGKAYPVVIKGIQRSWSLVVPKMYLTALGATCNKNSFCNGVIFEVTKKELKEFDKRESQGDYSRIKLDKKEIKFYKTGIKLNGEIYAYVANNPQKASKSNPLIQSYIDVVLTGCLEISLQFAKEFINTTKGWSRHWIDDRLNPRYPRAMKKIKYKKLITNLLNDFKKNKKRKRDRRE